ncbi:YbaY family lipoprotein [Wenzhouxiangella limi]|uniref:META domain-containing protein n=1 Tax=Wenzhouxiangella limi TaxID=2707351 RepID=A0A845V2M5_9GAMM|nr:YbaY family lipoprotein [Wenzhouxiangella limi]NDY96954.1 META domain-containing protein [Wenzhouxiangella limi]
MAEVSGQVFYVERIAAPPNARLEIVLEDISRQDVAAERLGEMVIEPAGQPPYEFSIEYDPAQIDPRHSYRVAARLYDGQDLLFTSDTVHQVLTRGFPATASVRMRRVARRPDQLLGAIPAAFAGTLPSAGPGVETQIHLLENGVYFMRETHLDRDNGTFDDIGRYLVSSDRKQLSLHGGREAPLRFAIEGPDALEMLDRDGARIDSELNYTLERKPQLALPEPRLLMGGKFRYLAGAGRFRECLTGLDLAVAAEEDNRALEEAYLEAREEPGEELKVSLEGRIEQRPSAESPEPVMTLVPERFIGVWPGQDCPPRAHAASLENTYWRLVLLRGSGVERFPNQREPHLVFRDTGEVGGSDGCNRLSGRYRSTGGSIEFSELVTTRRMCAQGMEQAETFVQTLSVANHVRVIGQHLEVLDEANNLLMRLEALAL